MRRLRLGLFAVFVLSTASCNRSPKPNDLRYQHTDTAPITPGIPIVKSNILKKVPPQYPSGAKAANIQGTVVLEAIIAEDGTVESLEAISGPEMLKGAAIDAVKQWVYEPYVLNGRPMRVNTKVYVNFQLTP
jgi:TonB family protein